MLDESSTAGRDVLIQSLQNIDKKKLAKRLIRNRPKFEKQMRELEESQRIDPAIWKLRFTI
jgi:hypothetical protein